MQYSANSDRALNLVINSKPTYVGRYRQAMLQLKDQEAALKHSYNAEAKILATVNLKKAEIALVQRDISNTSDEASIVYLKAKVTLIETEIVSILEDLEGIEDKRQDSKREIETCYREIERLKEESGIDFDKLSEADFQKLMVGETNALYARKLASHLLSQSSGLAPDICEMMLELPSSDRPLIVKESTNFLNEPIKLQEGA